MEVALGLGSIAFFLAAIFGPRVEKVHILGMDLRPFVTRQARAAAAIAGLLLLFPALTLAGVIPIGPVPSPSLEPTQIATDTVSPSPTLADNLPPTAPPPTAPPTSPANETAKPSQAQEGYPLEVASGSVGTYLTGKDGKTLYTFKNDTAGSGKSTCNGGCATNWPPYVLDAGDEVAPGDGVTGSITTITRDDGTTQVAYNGWPLYYFVGDTAAGDTNGQGVNDVWFVAVP
jgi:predicted lipoprotein with Yx(FWY)xxD motif